jgi:hypothetical protein
MLQNHNNKNSVVLAQKQIGIQWNKKEDPDVNPRGYSQQIFDKGA